MAPNDKVIRIRSQVMISNRKEEEETYLHI